MSIPMAIVFMSFLYIAVTFAYIYMLESNKLKTYKFYLAVSSSTGVLFVAYASFFTSGIFEFCVLMALANLFLSYLTNDYYFTNHDLYEILGFGTWSGAIICLKGSVFILERSHNMICSDLPVMLSVAGVILILWLIFDRQNYTRFFIFQFMTFLWFSNSLQKWQSYWLVVFGLLSIFFLQIKDLRDIKKKSFIAIPLGINMACLLWFITGGPVAVFMGVFGACEYFLLMEKKWWGMSLILILGIIVFILEYLYPHIL